VCVRVTLKDGKIDKSARDAVTIIQCDRPSGSDKAGTFAPLAMLRRDDPQATGQGAVHQIAYFHLRVWRNPDNNRVILAP